MGKVVVLKNNSYTSNGFEKQNGYQGIDTGSNF